MTGRFVCIYDTGYYSSHSYFFVLDEDGDGTFEEVRIPGGKDVRTMRESTLSIRGDKVSFVTRDRERSRAEGHRRRLGGN